VQLFEPESPPFFANPNQHLCQFKPLFQVEQFEILDPFN